MSMIEITSKIKNYSVEFGSAYSFLQNCNGIQNKAYVVDENVYRLYRTTLLKDISQDEVFIFSAIEERKTLESVKQIYDYLLQINAKRNLTLITVGGGILQDVSGFVASTLYRGINWFFLPTTLLSQADSCIGGKTSINYKNYKNLLGSFFPPTKILIDCSFLNSLEKKDYYSGLGEVIKLHIMGGKDHTQKLSNNFRDLLDQNLGVIEKMVRTSLEIKRKYILDDEFDFGQRILLNFGHSVGHAIESVTNFAIPHGQAIILGMIAANRISVKRGLLTENKAKIYENSFFFPALVSHIDLEQGLIDRLIDAMQKDKKKTGLGLAMVLLCNDNQLIKVDDVTDREIRSACTEFCY